VRAQVIDGVIGGGNGRSVRAAKNERPPAGSLADREIARDLGVEVGEEAEATNSFRPRNATRTVNSGNGMRGGFMVITEAMSTI